MLLSFKDSAETEKNKLNK